MGVVPSLLRDFLLLGVVLGDMFKTTLGVIFLEALLNGVNTSPEDALFDALFSFPICLGVLGLLDCTFKKHFF